MKTTGIVVGLPLQNSSIAFLHKELLFGAGNDRLTHSFIPNQHFGENTRGDVNYCLKCKSTV